MVVGRACASQDTTLLHVPVDHLSASLTLEMRGPGRPDWLITWNTHWPQHLPSTTSISPKPEHSRTVNTHPTKRTYKVSSGGWSVRMCRAKSDGGWVLVVAVLVVLMKAGVPRSSGGLLT
ncbi:hypothetical protein Hamer_G019639 [Homarus americanus]|uniref:Uncharacterized protein n=3 Tax=Homarus americanus TaxID=6706 RepID=A0A8J5K1E2_HOMAM|nr:hypothetical protein Hamer_G019639 [Homarus americanus]